eukprot:6652418-Prymnesium_polylepis.2
MKSAMVVGAPGDEESSWTARTVGSLARRATVGRTVPHTLGSSRPISIANGPQLPRPLLSRPT